MFGALGRRAPALGLLPGGAGGPVPLIGAGWLHPALAFSRASAAAIIRNATPPLTEVGNTAPRFDLDLGLLIEGQRTNLEANPRTPGRTGWSNVGLSSAMPAVGPNGVMGDATVFVEASTTDQHQSLSGAAMPFTAGDLYSVSFFARPGTCAFVQSIGRQLPFGSDVFANFGLNGAGSVGTVGSSVTRASITRYGDWYVCSYTAPAAASGAQQPIGLYMAQSLTDARVPVYLGTGRDVTLGPVWIEQAPFPTTPPLPATSGVATRLVESLSAPLSDLGIAPSGACTIIGTFMLPQLPLNNPSGLLHADDGLTANRYFIRCSTLGQLQLVRTTAGANSGALVFGTVVPGAPFRVAVSVDGTGRAAASASGGAVFAQTGGPTTGLTTLRIGIEAGNFAPLNGYAKRLSYLPRPTADADLPALSLRGNADLTSMQEIIQWP